MKHSKMLFIFALMAVFLVSTFLVSILCVADEGMYPLDSVDSWPVAEMKKNGLKIDVKELLNLEKAIAKVAAGVRVRLYPKMVCW